MTTSDPVRSKARLRTVADLGALVRDIRTRRGWTQAMLADKAAVGRQWLVAVEAGHHDRAEWGKVMQLLRALGIDLLVTIPTGDDAAHPPDDPSRDAGGEARRTVDLGAILDAMTSDAS